MKPSIAQRIFGQLPDGRDVDAWTLTGAGGLELEVITYGGIVTRLLTPDRNGDLSDVVLGFDNLDSYLSEHPYFGAIVGRVAGRIPDARITIDGRTYELPANDGTNHLHGGIEALDKRLWSAEPVSRKDGSPSLRLSYQSPDGEEGYPGAVDFSVTYTVTSDNAFVFETHATADRPTPVSLINHSYFNLGGEGSGTVDDHELQIHSDSTIATDENMTLLDRREAVAGHASDLNEPKRLGDVIPNIWQNHGGAYWLERSEDEPRKIIPVARVVHPHSGRVLGVRTTHDCLQFYTGSGLDASLKGKSGRPYGPYAALCLECEGYPNAVNVPGFGDILVRPGKPQHHVTVYAFEMFTG